MRNQARCGSFLRLRIAGGSPAECPSQPFPPVPSPARISVSSSLLMATMNQKSSLQKTTQSVSQVLMSDTVSQRTASANPSAPHSNPPSLALPSERKVSTIKVTEPLICQSSASEYRLIKDPCGDVVQAAKKLAQCLPPIPEAVSEVAANCCVFDATYPTSNIL